MSMSGTMSTMKWMGRSARNRAEAVGHQMKDRALHARLERAAEENERLRTENETLRDTVEESRTDHRRIMEMLESRLMTVEGGDDVEIEVDKKSHRGRRLLFLMMLAGGAWAWMRSKTGGGSSDDVWERPGSSMGGSGTTGGATGMGGTSGDTGMAT